MKPVIQEIEAMSILERMELIYNNPSLTPIINGLLVLGLVILINAVIMLILEVKRGK